MKCHEKGADALLSVQAGKGSATLSMAFAAAKFAESCLLALQGRPVIECAYVASHLTELPFFASQVRLGPNGVEVWLRELSQVVLAIRVSGFQAVMRGCGECARQVELEPG